MGVVCCLLLITVGVDLGFGMVEVTVASVIARIDVCGCTGWMFLK
jgi:hypothetical protein